MKKTVSLLLALVMLLALPLAVCAEDDSFAAGTVDGNTYWNEALSLGCTLGDDWYFYSDEEIVEVNGATADLLKDDLAEAVREAGTMMDMMAMDLETGDNVNVNLERLSLANSLLINEESYVKLSMDQMEIAMEQIGVTDLTMENGTMEFAGEDHAYIHLSGNMTVEVEDGSVSLPLYETLVIIKNGRTIIVVTACTYWEDTTGDILSNFYREKP